MIETNNSRLELEFSFSPFNSLLDSQNLLSNDRKHFNIDSVEFIEASPCSTLGQTTEETTHCLIIQTI